MYKVFIVDDEPLVQAGIKSMLNWSELNIEICGMAPNGQIALEMIRTIMPDIVITDIKMPVMDGLEFLKKAREEFGYKRPIFLLLTCYEDFHIAKEAVSYQVLEYLVKVELTPDSLKKAVVKALSILEENNTDNETVKTTSSPNLYSYKEKFLINLINNMFESDEQMYLQAKDLHINLDYDAFLCCYGSFETMHPTAIENYVTLYNGSMQLLQQLAEKYYPSLTISLDISHFAILFAYNESALENIRSAPNSVQKVMKDVLEKIRTSIKKYCSIDFTCGIGTLCSSPSALCESYQCARLAYHQTSADSPISYFAPEEILPHDAFNFSLFKENLTRAFEEYNSVILSDTIATLCDLIDTHPHHYVQALDAAINILYLAISLLPNSIDNLNNIFSGFPEGYMSIYRQTSTHQIAGWLKTFSNGICAFFDERTKDYKNKIVFDVKNYINEHISEKLSLNQIAAQFGISTSYLSQLFGRYSNLSFNEYINYGKIQEAKRLLQEEHLKIYEVAEIMSFGSEFYFSKVFKKVEGISPSEYINSIK